MLAVHMESLDYDEITIAGRARVFSFCAKRAGKFGLSPGFEMSGLDAGSAGSAGSVELSRTNLKTPDCWQAQDNAKATLSGLVMRLGRHR